MQRRSFRLIFAVCLASAWLVGVTIWLDSLRQSGGWLQPGATPTQPFDEADLWAAAVVATYEAQVFPEPLRSNAYAAIIWTMRNRVEIGFRNTVGYSDEPLLKAYSSYSLHRDDMPDPRALQVAREVLNKPTRDDDPTHGARNYVDHSYWTGTSEQIGSVWKYRGKFSDADVQRLVDDGKFTLVVEWKSPPERLGTPFIYGLYFFDAWPPPTPVVTPLPTFTRAPTATRTRTPTITLTPRPTPTILPTPSLQPYPRP